LKWRIDIIDDVASKLSIRTEAPCNCKTANMSVDMMLDLTGKKGLCVEQLLSSTL